MTLTSMFYLDSSGKYEDKKPYSVSFPVDHIPAATQTNIEQRKYADTDVADVRGHEESITLDNAGFQLVRYDSKFSHVDFLDFEAIREDYFAEVQEFLRETLKATWVKVFNCDIRRRSATYPDVQFAKDCQPVQMVHVDYSYDWVLMKALRILGIEGETRPGRIQEVTLWRPLKGPVRDWPLALCDFRSVDQQTDPVKGDQVYPSFLAENINFYHNHAHKWHFISDQQPDEAWLIKIMDTHAGNKGLAENCPHTAFFWHDAPSDREYRESIEVRTMVFQAEA